MLDYAQKIAKFPNEQIQVSYRFPLLISHTGTFVDLESMPAEKALHIHQ